MNTTIFITCMFQQVAKDKGLILTDLALLSWYNDFYPNMDKLPGAPEYRLLLPKKFLEDCPLVYSGDDSVRRSLARLVSAGMLLRKDGERKGTRIPQRTMHQARIIKASSLPKELYC